MTFNGVTAPVTSATDIALVVTVPPGVITGPIAVTVGAETATSSQDFVVIAPPVITALSPRFVLPEDTISEFLVEGLNLTGSTFSFIPDFALPSGIAVNSADIDTSGTSATLDVTVGTDASGQFVVIATNADGSSDSSASANNTFTVFNAQEEEEDTDGDGFINGIEAVLRSDPFDPNSIPNPSAFITEAVGPTFSLLNSVEPLTELPGEAVGTIFSLLNSAEPIAPELPGEAVSPILSIENAGP